MTHLTSHSSRIEVVWTTLNFALKLVSRIEQNTADFWKTNDQGKQNADLVKLNTDTINQNHEQVTYKIEETISITYAPNAWSNRGLIMRLLG
ncbi:hypothetical protein PRZ48_012679 [Zasmidium cellare]|uniref:Uncharacterized protein n=1 Tax=Zasmidium cellare TaxID=395010 RepID=A0ABR0E5J7_ZASCE|nr:hypothetical protein PRZ48_012679 [Zasmidium cellare]